MTSASSIHTLIAADHASLRLGSGFLLQRDDGPRVVNAATWRAASLRDQPA